MRCAVLFIAILIAPAASWNASAEEPAWPTPPRQGDPWIPSRSSLPRFLNTATFDLFAQGMADPRGCEYRRIRIKVSAVWGADAGPIETAGWVLPPGEEGGEPRFAIAWSGLVYPLVGVGKRAALDADVRSMGGNAPANRRVQFNALPNGPIRFNFNGMGTPHDERASTAVATLAPIRICLLLRLGRADLAQTIWEKRGGKLVPPAPAGGEATPDLNSYGLSYLTLAQDLAWSHFDRAVSAHMRKDDALALADARFLDGFAKTADARADEMGFPKAARAGGAPSYFDFLGQLPALLADQERRARERTQPPVKPAGEDQDARIAEMIRKLDQLAERQLSQPGGVAMGGSLMVRALIAEGDAAVEPLIRAYRTDDRLTRSVGFGRDFTRGRTILPVEEALHAALLGILKVSRFIEQKPNAEPPSRRETADAIEAYWRKNRSVSLIERWYQTLADDSASEPAWMEAAGDITRPESGQVIPDGGPFVMMERIAAKPDERPRLNGEPLREGHDPTVAALMIRRIESMLQSSQGQQFDLRAARGMATMLSAWDPLAALPTLRELSRICRERFARTDAGADWSARDMAVSIARFTLTRAQAGDAEAIPEYAAWIRTTSPERLEHQTLAVLEPIRQRPNDPVLAAAASWLFGDPASPWVPLIGRPGTRPSFQTAQLIASPLVEVPAFRASLLAALDDRTPIGTARTETGHVSVKLESGMTINRTAPIQDPEPPPPGAKTQLRRCDFYAWQLATLGGAPIFNPCWDETRRATALKATAEFLRRQRKP